MLLVHRSIYRKSKANAEEKVRGTYKRNHLGRIFKFLEHFISEARER